MLIGLPLSQRVPSLVAWSGEVPRGDVTSAQEKPQPEGLSHLGSSSPQPGLSPKTALHLLLAANPYPCPLCQEVEERGGGVRSCWTFRFQEGVWIFFQHLKPLVLKPGRTSLLSYIEDSFGHGVQKGLSPGARAEEVGGPCGWSRGKVVAWTCLEQVTAGGAHVWRWN